MHRALTPDPLAKRWGCKWKEKSTAGAQAKRGASGDRLFFLKCAGGEALSFFDRKAKFILHEAVQ